MIVCGGLGFIGGTFVQKYGGGIIDKRTYASTNRHRDRYIFNTDICNEDNINTIFNKHRPKIIVNFAAETHVDNSIEDSTNFIQTNVVGVRVLLDACRRFKVKKFVQISTDEVYGEIKNGSHNENDRLNPGNPYSASKSAADLLIQSYMRTYDFPCVIIRPCNNYGPFQHREKFIPNSILNKPIRIYGDGKQRREWLYVDDCVEGIMTVIEKGKIGEIYNLGSGHEEMNLDVALMIGGPIEHVQDRPGHDVRYKLNSSKIRDLGWKPKVSFSEGLKKTKDFYLTNPTL